MRPTRKPFRRTGRLRRLAADSGGMFTLEATLIFPAILLLNIAFIMFALYAYQVVTLHIHASAAAERIAARWHESPVEGRLPLYWRLTDNGSASFDIPAAGHADYTGGSVMERKIARGIRGIPDGISGTVEFENKVVRQFITVKLRHPMKISPFITRWLPDFGGDGNIEAEAAAEAMDSTEFSRYLDFAFGYAAKKNSNSIAATASAYRGVFDLIRKLVK